MNAAIDSFRQVFETNKLWDVIYSYYDLGEKFKTTIMDKSIITNEVKSDFWIKDKPWSEKKPNVELIYQLGNKLKIGFAVTFVIHNKDLEWDSNIYIIDVINKNVHTINKSIPANSFHRLFKDFAKNVFLAYETEIQSENSPEPQIAANSKRNIDPWTGIWQVEGHRDISGQWAMKQKDKSVVSTSDSLYELNGIAQGNNLKGRIIGDYNMSNRFELFISSDGQSFEGKLVRFGGDTHRIKGRRIE
jgi:hypothetical protein